MIVYEEGHLYGLSNFEDSSQTQTLRFITKENVDGKFVTVHDGTTNEEVIRVLLDRLDTLHNKVPNQHTLFAVAHLQEALMWLERRTQDRQERGVEGTPQA